MKIMIYSQHVLGIGHFFRSMEIAKALCGHEVLFVEGGEPIAGLVPPDHVKRVFLPPLMMDAEFTKMETRTGELEEIKQHRTAVLVEAYFRFSPHVFMTELFPFGRKQFRFELVPLLDEITERRRSTRVVCSLRDILVEKRNQAQYEEGVLSVLNRCYDMLLIHSDPRLTRLEETFASAGRIGIPIRYTGFVVRTPPSPMKSPAHRTVVVSSGGGKVGVDLLESTMRAFRGMSQEDLRLRVFVGPFMDRHDRDKLERLAASDERITLCPFSLDFLSELAEAELSVSMAGYNTCMDILSIGVKALVHPFAQNREQAMRAAKLQELGIVKVLESLEEDEVRRRIRETLEEQQPVKGESLDLAGAANTARLLEEFFRFSGRPSWRE